MGTIKVTLVPQMSKVFHRILLLIAVDIEELEILYFRHPVLEVKEKEET
jgi:hypothetical protein